MTSSEKEYRMTLSVQTGEENVVVVLPSFKSHWLLSYFVLGVDTVTAWSYTSTLTKSSHELATSHSLSA